MLKIVLAILRKDLILTLARSSGLVQALLLGLLLIFLFSLAGKPGTAISGQTAATIFWLSSAFCQVLIFNTLFSYEEENNARMGLLLSELPVAGVWLGKAVAGLVLILISQILFLAAASIFLGQTLVTDFAVPAMLAIVLVDVGLAAQGSLLGALAQGQEARESLLSLLIFPLIIPLLLAGISVLGALFGESANDGIASWLQFAAAFDAVFSAAGLILFRFIYTGDE